MIYFMIHERRRCVKHPVPTVDIIIEYEGGVVLIKRKYEPVGWALPGGLLELDESLEDAAVREAREETGLSVALKRQFHTYSEPGRDPRRHTVTTVYIAEGKGTLRAGDDAADACVFTAGTLPGEIVFDHKKILEDYFAGRH